MNPISRLINDFSVLVYPENWLELADKEVWKSLAKKQAYKNMANIEVIREALSNTYPHIAITVIVGIIAVLLN